jgi:hypothetical protein
MIKTFRGMLQDGDQNRIRLSTKKGKIGYQIINFQIIGREPGEQHMEHTVKIYKIKQTTIDNTVDFSDGNLLGVAYIQDDQVTAYPGSIGPIIFEREIFNQDIYITHVDTGGSEPCNYYLELETMSLTDNAATVSTLRDIRLNPQVGA